MSKKRWAIDKSFDFAYGHRVHNQTLNTEYTENNDGCLACRHMHGHQGKFKVFLAADVLRDGMVVDFKMLGWMKTFIDDVLDHKFIMDINDPLVFHEVPEIFDHENNILDLGKCIFDPVGAWVPDLTQLPTSTPQAVIEKYEGMVFVDFVPTSENLAAWLLDIAKEKMAPLGVDVVAVEFNETPKSHCRVEG